VTQADDADDLRDELLHPLRRVVRHDLDGDLGLGRLEDAERRTGGERKKKVAGGKSDILPLFSLL
jgi:hypothetical protein